MRLPERTRQQWLDVAERMRAVASDQFFVDGAYHPIRQELSDLTFCIDPTDMDTVGRMHDLLTQFVPTPEWAEEASADEVLAMVLCVLSLERWIKGASVEPHRNGFFSGALERIANSDAGYTIRS